MIRARFRAKTSDVYVTWAAETGNGNRRIIRAFPQFKIRLWWRSDGERSSAVECFRMGGIIYIVIAFVLLRAFSSVSVAARRRWYIFFGIFDCPQSTVIRRQELSIEIPPCGSLHNYVLPTGYLSKSARQCPILRFSNRFILISCLQSRYNPSMTARTKRINLSDDVWRMDIDWIWRNNLNKD